MSTALTAALLQVQIHRVQTCGTDKDESQLEHCDSKRPAERAREAEVMVFSRSAARLSLQQTPPHTHPSHSQKPVQIKSTFKASVTSTCSMMTDTYTLSPCPWYIWDVLHGRCSCFNPRCTPHSCTHCGLVCSTLRLIYQFQCSSPVPRTKFVPRAGAGSSSGQSKVKAQMVSGTMELKDSDCTTLPAYTANQISLLDCIEVLHQLPVKACG